MSTFPKQPNTHLHKPAPGERVPSETRDYLRARAKRIAYDLVMRELRSANITRAELARRLGKGADQVSRILGGPANWTISTLADLLFAISGGVPKCSVDYPLNKAPKNFGPREKYYEKKDMSPPDTTGGKSFPAPLF